MPCESTLVGIGTCPQHCIEPQLSQALLLGAHLSGPTYISFFSIAMLFPLCILFCYIPISWKPCLHLSQPWSATSFGIWYIHSSSHPQTSSPRSSSLTHLSPSLTAISESPPSTFPSRGHFSPWIEGGDAGTLYGTDQPELLPVEKVGPVNRVYLPTSACCFYRACAKWDFFSFQKYAAWWIFTWEIKGLIPAQKTIPLLKSSNEVLKIFEFFGE